MSFQRFASDSPWKTISFYPAPNNHILHNLFVYYLTHWFSSDIIFIRLPAFLAGILAIPFVFLLGRRLCDDLTALIAAGLLAVSSYHIQYSVNGRGYTMIVLVTIISFILADRIRKRRSFTDWFWFSVVCAAGFFTLPTMLYPYLGIMLWLFFSYLGKDTSSQYGGLFPLYLFLSGFSTTALTLLLYSPVILFSGWHSLSSNAFVQPLSWPQLAQRLPGFLSQVWGTWVRDMPVSISILIAVGVVLSLIRWMTKQTKNKIWLALPIALGCGLVLMVQRAIPYTRVWLFILPIFLLLAAAGWAFIFRRTLRKQTHWALVSILLFFFISGLAFPVYDSPAIYQERETGTLPQADKAADYLIGQIQPGDVVLSNRPGYLILSYYFQQADQDIPSLQAWEEDMQADRAFVVVNHFYDETINGVLNTTDLLAVPSLEEPRLIKEFEGVSIYRVEINP